MLEEISSVGFDMMRFLVFLLTISTIFSADLKDHPSAYRHAPTTCLTLEKKGRGYEGLVYLERNVIDFYSSNIEDIRTIADELQKETPDKKSVKKLMRKVLSSPVNLVFDYKRNKRQLLRDIKAYQEFIHSPKRYKMKSDDAVDCKVDLEQYKKLVRDLSVFFK